jgi:hypothetical protein
MNYVKTIYDLLYRELRSNKNHGLEDYNYLSLAFNDVWLSQGVGNVYVFITLVNHGVKMFLSLYGFQN